MKRILYLAAVTILAAVSCNKIENDAPAQQSNVPSFVASVDGANTKTVIDGMKSYWDGTEGIRVLDGSESKVYTATVEKAETATFTEKDATKLTGDDYLAVYPEGPAGSVTWDGNIANAAKKLWLYDKQIAVPGSYASDAHIAIAHTVKDNANLEFKNVTSLIKFSIKGDNIDEVCFFGNSGEVLSGNFDVVYNNGDPVVSGKDAYEEYNYTYVKLVAENNATLENGKTYYISVLPGEFEAGFGVETVVDGVKYQKFNHNPYTIYRNQIIDLGELEWIEPEPPAVTEKKLYLTPNSNWKVDNARFAAYFFGSTPNEVWVSMTDDDKDGIYELNIPEGYDYGTGNVIFCRMNPSQSANNWNNKWNQTADLKIPSDGTNHYTVKSNTWDKGGGTWSTK